MEGEKGKREVGKKEGRKDVRGGGSLPPCSFIVWAKGGGYIPLPHDLKLKTWLWRKAENHFKTS